MFEAASLRKGRGLRWQIAIVIESGVRDEASPFHATGVGPIAHSRSDGVFESWFVTAGTDGRATVPQFVDVFLEVDEGKWICFEFLSPKHPAPKDSDTGLALDRIEVDDKEVSR